MSDPLPKSPLGLNGQLASNIGFARHLQQTFSKVRALLLTTEAKIELPFVSAKRIPEKVLKKEFVRTQVCVPIPNCERAEWQKKFLYVHLSNVTGAHNIKSHIFTCKRQQELDYRLIHTSI